MQIIDGYCGAPNIYADDIGQYNISMWGPGDWVLPVGEQLGYELISNNEIQIKDGLFITQGRRGVIKKGSAERCIIENGTQAENRNDLIVIEYERNAASAEESHTLKVIRGTPGEVAADPEVTQGNIPEGALLHQMPLYRVKLEGLTIIAVEKLFQVGKISPETVDPMLATKEGLAADAKKTKDALDEQNDNISTLSTRIQSFEQTKSEIVSSGLGQALKLTAASTWATVVAAIKGVVNRGALNWSVSNTTHAVQPGYYTGGTLDSRPAYSAGYNNGYAAGKKNPSLSALYEQQYHSNDASTLTYTFDASRTVLAVGILPTLNPNPAPIDNLTTTGKVIFERKVRTQYNTSSSGGSYYYIYVIQGIAGNTINLYKRPYKEDYSNKMSLLVYNLG